MTADNFQQRYSALHHHHEELITRPNRIGERDNGVYQRWCNPVVTRDHVPLDWRYDLDPASNPYLMERIGVNSTFNSGAILQDGNYLLMVRIEGSDRKSWFAVAQSDNGIDQFRFWPRPVTLPQTAEPDTNVYDMRLTRHEDGMIYGLFCTERPDPSDPANPTSAIAKCGIARTSDLKHWERLPDLVTQSSQQRNVVLHPEFVEGRYALYTRPQDGFIEVGESGGICWGTCSSMEAAEIEQETVIEPRVYHTVAEYKNGQGPPPLKTSVGWLHLAHGVRDTAAGLRYVLYLFLTDLQQPWKVICKPGGYFLAPQGRERVGDVSNVVFSSGWIANENKDVFIYYASSDTRMHVATSTLDRLLDYCNNTPEDSHRSAESVESVNRLITRNLRLANG